MSENGIEIGDVAPGLALPGVDGERHQLGPAGEAPASVVYWTCNHCPYALAWQQRLHDVAADYADRGVRVLAVNSNDPDRFPADSFEAMVERVEGEGGWSHPYLHDASQEVARAYGARTTPDVFVFDSEPAAPLPRRPRRRLRRSGRARGLAARGARRGAGGSPA